MCEQLAQGRYLTRNGQELNSRPIESQANTLTITVHHQATGHIQ